MAVHCPEDRELAAFAEGRPTVQARETLAAHLSTCESCSRWLMESASGSDSGAGDFAPPADAPRSGVILEIDGSASIDATRRTPSAEDRREANAELQVNLGTASLQGEADTAPRQKESAARRTIGRYRLLEKIGQGGMGVVYKALDTNLQRVVAVKMISAGANASEHSVARFLHEGQAIASLAHPGVVQIHEWAVEHGQPYLVMEYVECGSLARRIGGKPQNFSFAANCLRRLAMAVSAAHARGILHRDLKPSNVLLGPDGSPKLGDFGVAKRFDAGDTSGNGGVNDGVNDGRNPYPGDLIGTASYMAPEQAAGRDAEIGPATDIYGLGAILYELLTGRPPYKEGDQSKTLAAVRSPNPPPPPSELNPLVPRALEAVCLKCLEKSPAKRYASADLLAKDLEAWLAGQKPTAPPVPRWRKALRRHLVAGAMAAALLLLAAAVPLIANQAPPEAQQADREAKRIDPDREIKRIERQLAVGERVTLIAESGAPKWFKWRMGAEDASCSLNQDGVFTVQAEKICLLELLRDPQATHYRIEAEVRHLSTDRAAGGVGLYFMHRAAASLHGGVQSFQEFVYNDIDDADQRLLGLMMQNDEAVRATFPPLRGNGVVLTHRFFSDLHEEVNAGVNNHLVANFQCPPVPQWRKLTIDMTPTTLTAQWDKIEPPLTLTLADIDSNCDSALLRREQRSPGDPLYRFYGARLNSHGGIGLCIHAGAASFRNVSIRPLAPPFVEAPK